jgi:hypothetical protein
MRESREPRSTGCPFCGGGPKSREHVLPRWCRDLIDPEDVLSVTRDSKQETRERKGWRQDRLNVVVKDVCKPCNNGWMARLEARTKPTLAPLLTVPLKQAVVRDKRTLATWGTKTILTSALLNPDPPPFIQDWQYRWFFDHQTPLPGSVGWFGSYDFESLYPYSYSAVDQGPIGSGAFRAVVNVGAYVFMIQVIPGRRKAESDDYLLPPPVRPFLTRLYPRWRRRFVWPTGRVMARHDLHIVAGIEHDAWENAADVDGTA